MNRRKFIRIAAAATVVPQLPIPAIMISEPLKSPWLDFTKRDIDMLCDRETLDRLTVEFAAYYKRKYGAV